MKYIFYRISEVGGALMFLAYPVSVSLSQFGLFLAALGWIGFRMALRFSDDSFRGESEPMPWIWDRALVAVLLVFFIEILSLVVNAFLSSDFTVFFARGIKSEPKDLFLVVAAFWTLAYTRDPKNRVRALKWLRWSIYILLFTGAISVWSKYRLNKLPYFMMHDWQAGPNARLQHHLGTIPIGSFPLHFYMPIGLMNTHLTYGGLLMFAFPMLLLSFLDDFLRKPYLFFFMRDTVKQGKVDQKKVQEHSLENSRTTGDVLGVWAKLALLALASLIFILNNGRSALLGALVSSLLGITYFGVVYWKEKSKRLIPLFIMLVFGLALFGALAPKIHPRLATAVNSLFSGKKKHTDYQRALVWNGAMDLAKGSPLIGVGAGHFESELKKHILEFGKKYPHLWVWYELAQRGHAHNDYLHLLAISGIGALLLYLVFFGLLIYAIFARLSEDLEKWKFAPIGLFIAGFLQCYFQDDEVLLPFFLYVGLILGGTHRSS